MYVYCVESFAHIECYRDVCIGGAIWLNPFATVLFSVCSDITVEFCTHVVWVCLVCLLLCKYSVVFCTHVVWVCLVYLLLCKEEGSSAVSLQLLREGIWACMRFPCLCWVLGLGLC